MRSTPKPDSLPHAFDRLAEWRDRWYETGSLALFLDFDGTLAPIVEQPDAVAVPEDTRRALRRLQETPGLHLAIVSGRGLDDVRRLAAIDGIAYAGNHGMEIEGAGLAQVHPEAAAGRPRLQEIVAQLERPLAGVPGALLEDKGLTLSIHYRRVRPDEVERVKELVFDTAGDDPELRVTEGKAVLEVRPRVDWHKGRAVEFLVERLPVDTAGPIVYIGDDTTDEDAFAALQAYEGGEGVIVAENREGPTVARAYIRTTEEVGTLLDLLGAPTER